MPDVDIDIGSARRDEVLAWVEERFGASTEAMVCNKISYKLPLAIQDLGRDYRGLGRPRSSGRAKFLMRSWATARPTRRYCRYSP